MIRATGIVLGGFAVAVWLILAIPAVAEAHALGVEAKLKDGKVFVEAFFDDNTPADAAKVVLTNADGKVIAEGKTDKDGKWSFQSPSHGKYKVTVDGGDGHRATVSLTIPIIPQAQGSVDLGPYASQPITSGEETIVSEGPTRSEFTGWRRFAWAAVGVVLIGVGCWALTRLLRSLKSRPRIEGQA